MDSCCCIAFVGKNYPSFATLVVERYSPSSVPQTAAEDWFVADLNFQMMICVKLTAKFVCLAQYLWFDCCRKLVFELQLAGTTAVLQAASFARKASSSAQYTLVPLTGFHSWQLENSHTLDCYLTA